MKAKWQWIVGMGALAVGAWLYAQSAAESGPGAPEEGAVWQGQKLSVLEWDANNPWETLAGFNVFLASVTLDPNAPEGRVTNFLATNFVSTNRIELTNILKELPNGTYRIHVTAVDRIGLESEPSTNVWMVWYGHPPRPVTHLTVKFPAGTSVPANTPPVPVPEE